MIRSFLNLLYPPLCLHCSEVKEQDSTYLCVQCSEKIELLISEGRCPACFQLHDGLQRCRHCEQHPSVFYRLAAACDYLGPSAALVKRLKYGNMPYLAQAAAAFMVAQWARLGWPKPDYIVPMPISKMRYYERGYNQALLIAQSMSDQLEVPCLKALGRRSGDYSQAGLSQEQRRKMDGEAFYLRKGKPLADKTLFLVDDVMTTGATMRCSAEHLLGGYPSTIYGLTFCMAET